jgi:hypothetical protein
LSAGSKPIGVLAALIQGFERVAARPSLILPPVLLDLLLWLGPQLGVRRLLEQVAGWFSPPPGLSGAVAEQWVLLQEALRHAAQGFNLLSLLSTIPVGVPSLMAGRMPAQAPWSPIAGSQLERPEAVMLVWLGLTALGLTLGALYQLSLARALAPGVALSTPWRAAVRVVLFSALLFLGFALAGGALLLAVGLATLLLPLLGAGVLFLGFSLLFWVGIYLAFTPHGIVRYDLGVGRAMLESFTLVRWNMLGTVGFFLLALGISWLANLVWSLPASASWFALLAILGHAFISTMLLTGSYAFYQGRREWLVAYRRAHSLGSAQPRQDGS